MFILVILVFDSLGVMSLLGDFCYQCFNPWCFNHCFQIFWGKDRVLIYYDSVNLGKENIYLSGLLTAAAAKSLQSCPTLCDPTDGSPPGSAVPGILQARTQEWVAISFSNAWKWKVKVKLLSHVWLFGTPGTVAHQAPPSMGFSRQEYWSGVPLPSPQGYLRA